MPAVIPIAMTAISAYGAYKNSKAAGKAGGAQNALLGEQTASARQGRTLGTGMVQAGLPATQSALSYYAKILQGNRAAMSQATAGANRQITDVYRGAERGLERQGVRGGVQQTALAELSRDRAAAVAGLTTGQQGNAANALADIGGNLTGQGMAGISGAASQFGSAANAYGGQASEFRQAGRQDMQGVGQGIGEILKIWMERQRGPSGSASGGSPW